MASIKVQVHGVGVATVGTLDKLSHNFGLVFILIHFHKSVHVYIDHVRHLSLTRHVVFLLVQ